MKMFNQLLLWNVVVRVWNLSYSSVLCGFYATQRLRIQMSFKVKALLFILKQQFTSVIENKNFCKKNLHKIS